MDSNWPIIPYQSVHQFPNKVWHIARWNLLFSSPFFLFFFLDLLLFAQSYRRISQTWSVYSTWWILITRVYLYNNMCVCVCVCCTYMPNIHSTLALCITKRSKNIFFFPFHSVLKAVFTRNLIDFHIILFFLRNAQKKRTATKVVDTYPISLFRHP